MWMMFRYSTQKQSRSTPAGHRCRGMGMGMDGNLESGQSQSPASNQVTLPFPHDPSEPSKAATGHDRPAHNTHALYPGRRLSPLLVPSRQPASQAARPSITHTVTYSAVHTPRQTGYERDGGCACCMVWCGVLQVAGERRALYRTVSYWLLTHVQYGTVYRPVLSVLSVRSALARPGLALSSS